MTWHGTSLYIMDPILGQLVAWYSLDSGKKNWKTLTSLIDWFSFIFLSTVSASGGQISLVYYKYV